jgi:hypothetical protein
MCKVCLRRVAIHGASSSLLVHASVFISSRDHPIHLLGNRYKYLSLLCSILLTYLTTHSSILQNRVFTHIWSQKADRIIEWQLGVRELRNHSNVPAMSAASAGQQKKHIIYKCCGVVSGFQIYSPRAHGRWPSPLKLYCLRRYACCLFASLQNEKICLHFVFTFKI